MVDSVEDGKVIVCRKYCLIFLGKGRDYHPNEGSNYGITGFCKVISWKSATPLISWDFAIRNLLREMKAIRGNLFLPNFTRA